MSDTETEDIHQPREHAVKCRHLCGRFTWEYDAICLRCKLEDAELIP